MRVVLLGREGCNQCAMMRRILGDRVEYADAATYPDLDKLTKYTALPLYLVYDQSGLCIGSFHGMMPRAEFERRLALY